MATVVFVETNFSGLDAIVYCKKQGHRCILITDSRERFNKWFPASSLYKVELADEIICVKNSNDKDELIHAIRTRVGEVDALLTFAEIRTLVVAEICDSLGLRGADTKSIEIAQNKYRFREVLLDKGVDDVKHHQISSPAELRGLKDHLTFPVFLKPTQGHSSIGARICSNKVEIESVISELEMISEDWISQSYVVEDYLDGQLVSVETLTTGKGQHQIIGISDRDVVKGSIEIGASFPLKDFYQMEIEDKARKTLDAIGYDFGPSHIELIVTNTGAHLVEVNTRVGGSGHSIMLDLATQRSIVGDCVELCLGNLSFNGTLYNYHQGAAWHCLVSDKTGVVKEIPSIDEITSLPGVKDVWLHSKQGDIVSTLDSNYSWLVQVMCIGNDQREAKSRATSAIEYIRQRTLIA